MEPDGLDPLDSFPYRHRVRDVMSAPLAAAAAGESIGVAARRMTRDGVSSLVVLDGDGRPLGIVTERDVLRAVAAQGADAPARPLADIVSAPVVSVDCDAFVYVALGRMDRHRLRHLVAVDGAGRAVGMVTSRALLRLRVGDTLQLGDRLSDAETPAAMDGVRRELPGLATRLLAGGVGAVGTAAVISAVYRDISARAAVLVEAAMSADSAWGPAPAPWCFLVLGSGGRGESLLAPDQDNAIVHAGAAGADPWYAEAGRRIADMLDGAGIPYCTGGVMAKNEAWRMSLADWRRRIAGWTRTDDPLALLQVDIFFDFVPVHGDRALAGRLRAEATAAAGAAPEFLRRMALSLDGLTPPLGLFGRFIKRDGRMDLKMGGLLPLVSGARLLAMKYAEPATATADRLLAAAGHGRIAEDDRLGLQEAQEQVMAAVLDQQLADLAAGLVPSTRVDPARWSRRRAMAVRMALRRIEALRLLIDDALAAGGPC